MRTRHCLRQSLVALACITTIILPLKAWADTAYTCQVRGTKHNQQLVDRPPQTFQAFFSGRSVAIRAAGGGYTAYECGLDKRLVQCRRYHPDHAVDTAEFDLDTKAFVRTVVARGGREGFTEFAECQPLTSPEGD